MRFSLFEESFPGLRMDFYTNNCYHSDPSTSGSCCFLQTSAVLDWAKGICLQGWIGKGLPEMLRWWHLRSWHSCDLNWVLWRYIGETIMSGYLCTTLHVHDSFVQVWSLLQEAQLILERHTGQLFLHTAWYWPLSHIEHGHPAQLRQVGKQQLSLEYEVQTRCLSQKCSENSIWIYLVRCPCTQIGALTSSHTHLIHADPIYLEWKPQLWLVKFISLPLSSCVGWISCSVDKSSLFRWFNSSTITYSPGTCRVSPFSSIQHSIQTKTALIPLVLRPSHSAGPGPLWPAELLLWSP